MMPNEIRLLLDRDHIESLRFLTRLRCLVHGDPVMVQRRGGEIVFWCGCVRAGALSGKAETVLKHKTVEVKR